VSWLPGDFVHPTRAELSTGHHLRPIRTTDVDLDYPAVMGSRERLWSIFGRAWGWPFDRPRLIGRDLTAALVPG
jgi:hypothetical protein